MTILNLHGYNGSCENTNFSILSNEVVGPEVEIISPQLDYLSTDSNIILDQLSKLVEDAEVKLIVATSFGAFFGKILSVKYQLPLVATNPCLDPAACLSQLAPEYFTDYNKKEFVAINMQANNQAGYLDNVFILGINDSIIKSELTCLQAADASFYFVEGGHQLDPTIYRHILSHEVMHRMIDPNR